MKRLWLGLLLLPLGAAAAAVTRIGPPPSASVAPPTAPVEAGAERSRPALPAYARLLARHTAPGAIAGRPVRLVDYRALARDPDLAAALAELDAARLDRMSRDERLAFWINAYNLLAMNIVAEEYPVRSITDIRSWGSRKGEAAGRSVSLHEIDEILLEEFGDPRRLAALVAAAVSCPDLLGEPYDGARLDAQLDAAMTAFLADPERGVRRTSRGVAVSPLLFGYREDFGSAGIVGTIRAHAPAEVAGWLEGVRDKDLLHLDYDWTLNDRARADVAR